MRLEPQRLGDPECLLSLAPSQFPNQRDFPEKSASWLPPSLPRRLQAKVRMRLGPTLVSLFLLLREARESGGEQPQH